MDRSKPPLQTQQLSKAFGARFVLREIDFALLEGQCVALTGANGAGKTTLLRCLASVLRPTAGEVRWFGESPTAHPSSRRHVGLLAHESCLYSHLTLRENLIFAARMYDVPRPHETADRWLDDAGLASCAYRLPKQISKGMRQRLAVVRSLVHEPRILLFDEPSSSLDVDGTDWLVERLQDLRERGRAICFATHDPEMVRRLATRVVRLESGRLRELETESTDPSDRSNPSESESGRLREIETETSTAQRVHDRCRRAA